MKKTLMTILLIAPAALWAQHNTWEQAEREQQQKEAVVKENPDQKYLAGAVPVVDGKVVFATTIEAPGKTAAEIYDIVGRNMQKMTHDENQINSKLIVIDEKSFTIGGSYEEWLVFKRNALSLDRARFYYTLEAKCEDGRVSLTLSRIRYLYDEERTPQRIKAEEWITDREAVNKKNTKLMPLAGKFRRKTIDRKDFIFAQIASELQ